MSERGQKLFKIFVWITIAAMIAFAGYREVRKSMFSSGSDSETMTNSAWVAELEESTGTEYPEEVKDPDGALTGKNAALSSAKILGDERLGLSSDSKHTDEERVNAAVAQGIVSEKSLTGKLTAEDAASAAKKVRTIYRSPKTWPKHGSAKLADGVVDGTDRPILGHNDDYSAIDLEKGSNPGNPGDVIIIRNDDGNAIPREVTGVDDSSDTSTHVETKEKDPDRPVVENIDFSGAADLSDVTGGSSDGETKDAGDNGETAENKETDGNGKTADDGKTAGGKETAGNGDTAGSGENAESKETAGDGAAPVTEADIEVTFEKTEPGEADAPVSETVLINGEELEQGERGSSDESGNGASGDGGSENVENGLDSLDPNDKISGSVEFKDLSVVTDGQYDFTDPANKENEVRVIVNAVIINNITVNIHTEYNLLLFVLPAVPVSGTNGLVNVTVRVYGTFKKDGSIDFTYEVTENAVGTDFYDITDTFDITPKPQGGDGTGKGNDAVQNAAEAANNAVSAVSNAVESAADGTEKPDGKKAGSGTTAAAEQSDNGKKPTDGDHSGKGDAQDFLNHLNDLCGGALQTVLMDQCLNPAGEKCASCCEQ